MEGVEQWRQNRKGMDHCSNIQSIPPKNTLQRTPLPQCDESLQSAPLSLDVMQRTRVGGIGTWDEGTLAGPMVQLVGLGT